MGGKLRGKRLGARERARRARAAELRRALRAAESDWASGRAYVDAGGHFRLRRTAWAGRWIGSGPVAWWSWAARRLAGGASELHQRAQDRLRRVSETETEGDVLGERNAFRGQP